MDIYNSIEHGGNTVLYVCLLNNVHKNLNSGIVLLWSKPEYISDNMGQNTDFLKVIFQRNYMSG